MSFSPATTGHRAIGNPIACSVQCAGMAVPARAGAAGEDPRSSAMIVLAVFVKLEKQVRRW
jgi:hypothetical protein